MRESIRLIAPFCGCEKSGLIRLLRACAFRSVGDFLVEQIQAHIINETGHLPHTHFSSELHLYLLAKLILRCACLYQLDGLLPNGIHSLLESRDVGLGQWVITVSWNSCVEIQLQNLCQGPGPTENASAHRVVAVRSGSRKFISERYHFCIREVHDGVA